MLILDVVDGRIEYVEIFDRPRCAGPHHGRRRALRQSTPGCNAGRRPA
ncbi:hypothetical protein ACGFYQ_02275 [Streptomyces sp. NPDC048258]